jgi:hypothetical protein
MRRSSVLLLLALTACNTMDGSSPSARLNRPALSETEAKAAILANIKDPDSAKITNIIRADDYVCAMVNSKNSFGGYTGPKGVSVGPDSEVLIAGESASFSVWVSPCWETLRTHRS